MAYATYEHDGRRRVGRVEHAGRRPADPARRAHRARPRHPRPTCSPARPSCPREAVAAADVYLCPVVPHPDKIICVGLNYRAHVDETGRDLPAYPVMFTKFASSLIGPRDDILLPAGVRAGRLRGRARRRRSAAPGRRIPREQAPEHVLGYTVANDVTMRDFQYKTHQWLQGKAWDNSTPLGPYLVLPGEADVSATRGAHRAWAGRSCRTPTRRGSSSTSRP